MCLLIYDKMVSEFGLEGVPSPIEEDKYSYKMLYAGIYACQTTHRGITVSKMLHAYTTYYDILEKEQKNAE